MSSERKSGAKPRGKMDESPATEEGVSSRGGPGLTSARVWLAVGFLALLAVDAIHARIPPDSGLGPAYAFLPDPELARVLSLGFGPVVADFYWLQAVQAVGGEGRMTPELAAHLGKLIDLVTTLDPWVEHPYRFAAVWMTQSEEIVRAANRLLERAIDHHPGEWRNYFYLGFNHFFYLLENNRAAEILERASALPGAPRYLPRLPARLKSEAADIDVAVVFLGELLASAHDEAAKEGYRAALDEIEVEQKARMLDRARAVFRQRAGRDIVEVIELVEGPSPVLETLPAAIPSSLPASLRRGSEWRLDPENGRIFSTYYGKRYQLHIARSDRERAERWAEERRVRKASGDPETRKAMPGNGASQHER